MEEIGSVAAVIFETDGSLSALRELNGQGRNDTLQNVKKPAQQ